MKTRKSKFFSFLIFLGLVIAPMMTMTSCSSVSISQNNISLYVDDTYDLTAKSSDEDALVLWKSSDNNVAVVRRGKVTAVGKGECDITAYDDNGATAACHVKVDAMNITISHSSKSVDLGHLRTFLLSAESEDGGEVTWSSDHEDLATVNQNGLVTCLDTGSVAITAYRKGGKAKCSVSIFDSQRADDYYVMEKGQAATVMDDPGVWYYWPNGSSTVGKTTYQNQGFTSSISSLDGNGVLYRYQPGGKDNTGLTNGDKFSIFFKIKLNVSTQLRGKKTMSVTANEWADYSFTGTVGYNNEPFYFSIRDTAIPSSGSITIEVKDILVSASHAADYYEIQSGNNAAVSANPGKWYYWANGSDTVSKAYYESAQVNISINKLNDSQGMYFRYQPGGNDGSNLHVGDTYNITLKITMNVTGTFTGKSSATVTTPGTFVTYTYDGTVTDGSPFQITLKGVSVPSGGTIDITMKEIVITNTSTPTSGYTVIAGQNATVVANPGRWYYWTNGSGDAVSVAKYTDDVLTASITGLGSSQGIYFRYQPGGDDGTAMENGDNYTISFKITMNITGTIQGKSSATVTTAGEFVTYIWHGAYSTSSPFNFTIKSLTIPSSGSIDITVKEVSITPDEVIPPAQDGITSGDQTSAIGTPGDWFISSGTGDVITSSSQTNTGFTVNISALSSNEGITLYYQPGGKASNGLLMGDDYTLNANVKMNSVGTIGGSESTLITTTNTNVALSHTGVINNASVFTINIKNIDIPANEDLVVTLSSLSFKSLGVGTKAVVRANPGIWHYNSAGSAAFNVIPRKSHDLDNGGTLGVEISAFSGDHFYFRYQPTYTSGTSYRISCTIMTTTNANISYGNKDSGNGAITDTTTTANTPMNIVFENTVSDLIFYILINKNNSTPVGVTVSNIVVEAI